MDAVSTQGMRFVDSLGRECIFNGLNLVNKGKPSKLPCKKGRKYDFKEWDEKLIISFKERGFNVVRLGLTWEGVEPEPGKYDDEYLAKLASIARLLEKHGIYFFLDMHQDLYGSGSKIGDGAPDWACITGGAKFKKPIFIWAEGYFYGKAVQNSFDAFWRNEKVCGKGLQEHYTDMWKHVAEKFKDNTALLGFDIMNEPYPGSDGGRVFTTLLENMLAVCAEKSGNSSAAVKLAGCFDGGAEKKGFAKLGLKLAGAMRRRGMVKALREAAGKKESFHAIVLSAEDIIRKFDLESYTPFINRVSAGIREVTDKGIIFMENSYYSNLGIPYSAQPVTIGGEREKNLAFAPHGYDLFVDSPLYRFASNERTDSIFTEHINSQQRLQTPVLVGEFGGFTKGGGWLGHIRHLYRFFEQQKWSQTYWCYCKNVEKSPVYDIITRSYPRRVNGEILSYRFSDDSKLFELKFKGGERSEIPSEIFLTSKPKHIETTCRYTLEPVGKDSVLMLLYADRGEHSVTVYM